MSDDLDTKMICFNYIESEDKLGIIMFDDEEEELGLVVLPWALIDELSNLKEYTISQKENGVMSVSWIAKSESDEFSKVCVSKKIN